jgi:predicted XRE-type DNA-binding protein
MSDDLTITRGSGNVFDDLALPNPEEHRLKAHLALAIANVLDSRGLSQTATAELLGITQPDVSNIVRGRLHRFSIERLLAFVRTLGSDIEVKVSPASPSRQGRFVLEPA